MIGILGTLLFWGGYYGALAVAWRAGVRNGVLFAVAVVMGICGCFGVPLLAYFWSEVQKRTFALVEAQPADAAPPAHMRHYGTVAAVAVVGLVLQILGGNLIPDDDGYDEGAWSDAPVPTYEPVVDYEPPPTEEELEEAWEGWEEHVGDEAESDELAGEATPAEDELAPEDVLAPEDAEPTTIDGAFLGALPGRRVAVILAGEHIALARRARGGWPVSLVPCASVSLAGEHDAEGVFVVTETAEIDGDGCAQLPRPEVVRSYDAPLADHAGRYVVLPAPHAETPTRLRLTEELTLTVRAPRGAIARDTDYTAVRGVLVDTGRGMELWILRADDVVGL